MTTVNDLSTPALVLDRDAFWFNLEKMSAVLPGDSLRPHVKAHKCTEIARAQETLGHNKFCAATPKEIIGLAATDIGSDLLLANETVDAVRLSQLATLNTLVTIAVDSDATIDAAAKAGIKAVLIDVNVGLPRCGCDPQDAGRLADRARSKGLEVRGVMGYEGHVVGLVDALERAAKCERSMELLLDAHALVGGEIISAGGTGTHLINTWANEIQAGSYALMDTAYGELGLGFRPALRLVATVISVGPKFAVADCGLKSLGMDHGNPLIEGSEVLFCSDEHTTFRPGQPRNGDAQLKVGDRVLVQPAHIDPTVAYHERIFVADGRGLGAQVTDQWQVDLRGW